MEMQENGAEMRHPVDKAKLPLSHTNDEPSKSPLFFSGSFQKANRPPLLGSDKDSQINNPSSHSSAYYSVYHIVHACTQKGRIKFKWP